MKIFYNDFCCLEGLIILGSIESGVEKLANMSGDIIVTIERID